MARKIKRRKLPRPRISRRNRTHRGMKGKLTLAARKTAYAAAESGFPLNRLGRLIGVSKEQFNRYLDQGKDPKNKKQYRFVQKLKKIEKQRELEALNVIRIAGKGGFKITKNKYKTGDKGTEYTKEESILAPQWQAAAWFLERIYKDVYGKEYSKQDKSPAEYAQEIHEATSLIFDSVPIQE